MTDPSRILISRLSAHGDVALTLPVIAAIRARLPNVTIGWLVDASAVSLLQGIAGIDALHVLDTRLLKRVAFKPLAWRNALQHLNPVLAALAEARYDAALDVQGLLKSALPPYLARIPRRFGFAGTRECADLFYTDALPAIDLKDASRHVADIYDTAAHQMLDALDVPTFEAARPAVSFRVPKLRELSEVPEFKADALAQAPEALSLKLQALREGVNGCRRPLVILAPATRWASKRWPQGYWAKLLEALIACGYAVALIGGPEDAALCQGVLQGATLSPEARARVADLCGQTNWQSLWAVFTEADVLIGPDSAPLHMAAAVAQSRGLLGAAPKVIGLFGPTAIGRTGPYGQLENAITAGVACQPCFKKRCPLPAPDTGQCMTALTPEAVLTKVLALSAPVYSI
ncbi:MAG: glycosyltransferase family 9 protein [Vampirovibrionales bacterium]|nr:glycosyltransferase family 9 protein [Vampirovibrionales bacterium]